MTAQMKHYHQGCGERLQTRIAPYPQQDQRATTQLKQPGDKQPGKPGKQHCR